MIFLGLVAGVILAGTAISQAKDIPYYDKVRLKVGQSIVLKGVRTRCNGKTAPKFSRLTKLPKPKLGVLVDGGAGTVLSKNCDRRVPARAIRFKATKKGRETITIYDDRVSIRVD